MSRCVVFCLMAVSSFAFAEDGLVVQFTISEGVSGAGTLQTYTDAILMRFDEEASFELDDRYVLKIRSHKNGPEKVELLITLKDVVDGKPYYIGASPVRLAIGDATELKFERNGQLYGISLDTSYGRLPADAPGQGRSGTE